MLITLFITSSFLGALYSGSLSVFLTVLNLLSPYSVAVKFYFTMSDTRICGHCNANIAGDAHSCPCGAFYHPGCLNLAISKSTGKRKCCSHKPTSRSLSPTPATQVTLENITKMFEDHYLKAKKESEDFITNKLSLVQQDIADINSIVNSYTGKFDNAFERIENLETQVQEIRQSDKISQQYDEGHIMSQCLAEMNDRLRRKQNLIFFGCPEVSIEGKPNKSQLHNLDTSEVNKFLFSINSLHKDNDIIIKRIGTYDQNMKNPRPIRIIFSEEQKRMSTFSAYLNWRKMAQNTGLKLSLTQDRTFLQRKQHREIKKTLIDRRNGGEENLVIREIHGEPRIVKKTEKQTPA